MIVNDGACGDGRRKIPFAAKHPILCGLGTMFLGILVLALIDLILYAIGGVKLVERLGIVSIVVLAAFFLKGYVQMDYPPRY
jgi:hypothetical protein